MNYPKRVGNGNRPKRPLLILDHCIAITLSDGSLAYVDHQDRAIVEGWNWTAERTQWTTYAKRRCADGTKVYLHRAIMGDPAGPKVDHRDHDGLNCRRVNLRIATDSENAFNQRLSRRNTSGFKGVYWHSAAEKWAAEIRADGQKTYLGLFESAGAAADAYDTAALRLHGEFACTNAALAA